jgi:hypothetical protein
MKQDFLEVVHPRLNGKKQKKDPNTVDPQHIYVKFLYIYKNFIQIIDTYI